MQGGSDFIHPKLLKFHNDIIKTQYGESSRFKEPFSPIQYCLGLCGRTGVGKWRGMQQLLLKDDIPYKALSVIPHDLTGSVGEIVGAMSELSSNGGVVVVSQADYLALNVPSKEDNKLTTMLMTLAATAKRLGIMLVALFDFLPPSFSPEAHLWFHTTFWNQFPEIYWVPAPNSQTRERYIQECVETWARASGIQMDMHEVDWKMLADYSQHATFEQIDLYLRRVCRRAAIDHVEKLELKDFEQFLSHAIGKPHISTTNCRKLEEPYSLRFGQGPLDPIGHIRPDAGFKVPQGYKLVKEDEEEKGDDGVRITAFTEGFVDIEKVEEELGISNEPPTKKKKI